MIIASLIDYDLLFRVRAQLNELIDFRDLAPDLWDAAKVLIGKAVSARAAGQHDFAHQLALWAHDELFDLAVIADLADPPDLDDWYWN